LIETLFLICELKTFRAKKVQQTFLKKLFVSLKTDTLRKTTLIVTTLIVITLIVEFEAPSPICRHQQNVVTKIDWAI
jgi:hypothetical protein